MYRLVTQSTFFVENEEQAEYINKLYDDLQALITCATSHYASTIDKTDSDNKVPLVHIGHDDYPQIAFCLVETMGSTITWDPTKITCVSCLASLNK